MSAGEGAGTPATILRPRRPLPVVVAAALAAAAPFLGEFWLFAFTLAIVYVLASLSLVVLTGWSGQLNLHVSALGLGWGSYAAFALVSLDIPPFIALLAAGALTIPFAAIVAAAAVRFRGLELAVATLAIGLIFERLFFRNLGKWLSSSGDVATPFETSFVPMPRPALGSFSLNGDLAFFVFSLMVAGLLFVLVTNIGKGATGRTFRAVRERELMAEAVGVPVLRYRITAFVVSIFIAATAGALFASLKLGIAPDSYNLDASFQILAATVIGGIRSPGGALIGGALGALLPELVRFGPLQIFSGERLFVLFGAGMVFALWRLPEGLVGLGDRLRARRAPAQTDDATALATMPVHANGGLSGVETSRRIYRSRLDRQARPTLLRVDGVRVRFGGVVALARPFIREIRAGQKCRLPHPRRKVATPA
ncbi:MAG: branched-chain amino acid ABC transporter permease, partial [Vicinamibacteria bacterium]